MVESLKKLREPAAFVVLAALAVRLLVGLVSVFVLASVDRVGTASAARSVAGWVTDPLATVVLLALTAGCVLWQRTPRARLLAQLSAIVVTAGVAASLVLALIGTTASQSINRVPALVVFLTDLAVPTLVAVALFRLVQSQPVEQRPALRSSASDSDHRADAEHGSGELAVATSDPDEPTWQPDVAAGAVWTTAGDAASGAAASGWGTPGDAGGWVPAPSSPDEPVQVEGQPRPSADPHHRGGASRGDR
ncbi:MAG: hypothetical protein AVDCRST_MAG75-2169 [uncultured Propionibacteriaceae bacterium]|uniref:DUF2637 domain-containing protein n=1 Tax=uncultured Propionibacteriaceae bacterium TaxID=257457 RepID=A0A6J4NZ30_9ACTN|nr:MAG: hypothetical protein AVDCRST_MAG75-2169 [uncultured Propionibacteriaceae bacterium]